MLRWLENLTCDNHVHMQSPAKEVVP